MIILFGLDLYRGYRLITQTYRHLFPRTPNYSRFYRVLRNAVSLLAHLAQELANSKAELFVVDLKPVPLARGHRIHTHALPEAAAGLGFLGGFSGFALAAVMDEGVASYAGPSSPATPGRPGPKSLWPTLPPF